jgi:hypothetical protein
MAGEIWHLSIEDLFQPVQELPRLGGDGPFVINLSVSTAPISVPTKALTNSHLDAHVYQIQVTEDGRTRYRLRLGPFGSEDEADAILAEVRDTYPGALTATASASDLRVIESMQAKIDQRPKTTRAADLVIEKSVSQKIAAAEVAPIAPAAAVAAAAPVAPKAAPQKAAAAPGAAIPKAEVAEISIDIAWPTPELGVPPGAPRRAAPAQPPPPAVVRSEPRPVAMTAAAKPQWALPELDVPLPTVQKPPAAPPTPLAKEAAAPVPAPEPFELKLAPPFSLASLAPVLTEVVTRKPAAPKHGSRKPAALTTPVLTELVAAKIKAAAPTPPATAQAATALSAVAPAATVLAATAPTAATPTATAAVSSAPSVTAVSAATVIAAEVKMAPHPESAPPLKQEIAPAPKKAIAPPPKQTVAAPSKPTGPSRAAPVESMKPAPVLPQSIAPARKPWPKFRAALTKPAANKLTSLQHVVVATAAAPNSREVKKLDEPLESLESTQTIRALTPMELEDNEASRWFVIQLALADHAFDPDALPNLDIFSEYRLYSVAGLDQGRVVHALRLGFFREEIGAVAVASYLAAYWEKPAIKRVSLAERERFADQRVEARKDVGATGKHAVIEITDELVARRRRSSKAAPVKTANRPLEH